MDNIIRSKATARAQPAPLAGIVCLFGFFLHIFLSDPLLNALGFHYSGEAGAFYEKIHPGTVFIFLSFAMLLFQNGNPLHQIYKLGHEQTASTALLIVCVLMFFYMLARSGAGGSAFIIDTHMTPPICAMVLCSAPASQCRRALHGFIAVAAINGVIGIAEAIGHFRIFTFDPQWTVLHEEYFRSSALLGHPLNNAMFTAVALFTMLAMRYPWPLTAQLVALFMTALVAFGGRIALAFSVIAFLGWGAVQWRQWVAHRQFTPMQFLTMITTTLLVPLLLISGLYLLLHSGMGERIAARGLWDSSAHSRALAPMVLDFMKDDEIIFGISPERIMAITARVNQHVAISDIENPWLLMFMNLGAIVFPFWLAATFAFVRRLLRDQSLAAKLAVLAYFVTASTSNSFGRKDSTYLIMVCAVMSLARLPRRTAAFSEAG